MGDDYDTQSPRIKYTNKRGNTKTKQFNDVTKVQWTGTGNNHQPWYVLIGTRPDEGEKENVVLDGVIDVKNDSAVLEQKLPRVDGPDTPTPAEIEVRRMGLID
jgi:hypothetical protein